MRRNLTLWLVLVLALGTLWSGVAHAGAVISNVFNSNSLAANDDSYTSLVSLGFDANFFGTTYTGLYVDNNGDVTFNSGLSTYTPFGLTTDIGTPIIAPFFADVDTRAGNVMTYGTGTYGGHNAFGVNWINVGYYSYHTDKLDSFQLILVDRSDIASGDFDIMFNYDQIQWETGDASDGSGGLGGSSAHVGYSNGSGDSGTYYEFTGSGVNGAFLDGGADALISDSNVGIPGRYIFEVRSGIPTVDYSRYDFTYYYNNGSGDYYTGSVYALSSYNGYGVGYTQYETDENGQSGYYYISAATDLGSDDSKVGQVYVTSYYDKESNKTYTPVSSGTAVGTGYLGSEHDYIIKSGVPEFLFGYSNGTFYEADAGNYSRYDFNYYYSDGSSDYYTGYVYALTSFEITSDSSTQGFIQVGTHLANEPEGLGSGALSGYYDITAITDGYDSSYDKKEYITAYYDGNIYHASEGVNTDASTTAATVYVADRTTTDESGYVVTGAQINYGTNYLANSGTCTPVSPFGTWSYSDEYGFFASFTPYLTADRPKLMVEVDIQLSGDDPGTTLENTWQTGIYTAWNNKYSIQDGTESYYIEFVVEWVTSGADKTVTVHNDTNNWTGTKPENMTNWYINWDPGNGVVNNSQQGVVIAHEFGHIIGLYDEYAAGAMEPGKTAKTNTLMADYGPVQDYYYNNMLSWLETKSGTSSLTLVAYSASSPGSPPETASPSSADSSTVINGSNLDGWTASGSQSSSHLEAAASQAVWAAYWSQTGNLLEEEK